MSFRQVVVTINAVNRASRAFDRVGSDASKMGTKVKASGAAMNAEFSRVRASVTRMGAEVKSVQTTLTGGFVQVGAEAENMASKTEASTSRMTAGLSQVGVQAELSAAQIKVFSSKLIGIGALGVGVTYIARQFGILNDEQTRTLSSTLSVITAMGMFMRTSWGVAVAQKVYAVATWIATAAQNALNISYATFLALTGVGIAIIAAAAVAMWSFANSMNSATASVREFNAAASETPRAGRSIRRAGEEELYRKGVEY